MKKKIWLMAITLLIAVGVYYFLPDTCPEAAKRTAFVFTVAALFWALEIIPHYGTSLVVVLLLIVLIGREGGVLDLDRSGYRMFLVPFSSPVIMLFFGGFALARALRKYHVDSYIADRVLSLCGDHPYRVLLGIMLLTAVLSMWTSNTATTAIMLGIIAPFVATLKEGEPFCKGLILSVPFAANIGGIGTPIGTPPNVIVLGNLAEAGIEVSFIEWMMIGVPLAVVLLGLVYIVLRFFYPLKDKETRFVLEKHGDLPKGAIKVFVIFGITVTLWLTTKIHGLHESVTALIAVAMLIATGLLDRDDMKKFDWDVLVLMWGGLALGAGIQASGLATWLVDQPLMGLRGMTLIISFSVIALALSSFMSHTAAATLIIPIAMSIPTKNPIYLAIAIGLACSFAMAFPISTPPNALAFAGGKITTKDMMKPGTIISLVSLAIMLFSFKFLVNLVFGL